MWTRRWKSGTKCTPVNSDSSWQILAIKKTTRSLLTGESKPSGFNQELASLQPETVHAESQDILKHFQCLR